MSSSAAPPAFSFAKLFPRRRVLFTLAVVVPFGLLLGLSSLSPTLVVVARGMLVGLCAMLAYGVFEQWPGRLPPWLERWALQLIAVVIAVPLGALAAYWITLGGDPQFSQNPARVNGYLSLTVLGGMVALWIALGAMVRQREALARDQALAFELERSELARQALDARMQLLQAQVQPHFLFNTLANVQALVETGSPQASKVLDSLIAYLRAAVPRLDEPTTTLRQELELVRAYLELMHMRMPDRLQFGLQADAEALAAYCPPMTLMTLVENAVRHGIDPSEEGGRIEVDVQLRGDRCSVRVTDSGAVLKSTGNGLGTGLANLRERLRLFFGADAELRLLAREPRGTCAEVSFPLRREETAPKMAS
ncbi:MAG TPA: histidine kinase [Burkholderiaceae bacterium]|nr:histidine kinase [Burkholderiaceae bacterium]